MLLGQAINKETYYKSRDLTLRLPQIRNGVFPTVFLSATKEASRPILALMEMVVNGVSARKV